MTGIVSQGPISLSLTLLPYYALCSVGRMLAAFVLSTVFTLVYGYVASHNQRAEAILIPILDILQSVPVLGFLSVSVASFASLFPGSTVGFELASIFAIFTSQAWNMTFSFYQSLSALPKDLLEASSVFGLNRWQAFKKLELPYSVISLVWNGMMSFGGGWFFLAASEAITVLGRDVRLPGIGSYMATAIEESDIKALEVSLLTMIVTIVILDQVIWKPLVAWSKKFKVELTSDGDERESLVLDVLSRSLVLQAASRYLFRPFASIAAKVLKSTAPMVDRLMSSLGRLRWALTLINYLLWFVVVGYGILNLYRGLLSISTSISLTLMTRVLYLGFLTFLRVMASVVLGMLWTIPVGVKIGTNPRLRQVLQPLVQILASFPANMLFPFVTMVYLRYRVNFQLGSIPLMTLGTQWYLLFNVIAGAMAIP